MGRAKPNPIQVVEFPTYSFGLKLSNVRCLESSFNERVIPANQSVVDFFFTRSCEILFMYVENRGFLPLLFTCGFGQVSSFPKNKFSIKATLQQPHSFCLVPQAKSFSWHWNNSHLKNGSSDEPVLYWKYKKKKKGSKVSLVNFLVI